MSIEENLKNAGHPLPPTTPPVGSYVPAIQAGPFLYTSGQIPMVAGTLPDAFKGKVGTTVSLDNARMAAITCTANALSALKAAIGDLDRIERVVKIVGFVASEPSFSNQSEVMNAASDLLQTAFGDSGRHARSAVGVAVLPRDACVEVEMIVQLREG